VDFYLPDYNIVVFCDGDYWHNPEKFDKKDLTDNMGLEVYDNYVFRFSEKNLMKDATRCIDEVTEFIFYYL
jgi:very-short-patch-repair endonuclease